MMKSCMIGLISLFLFGCVNNFERFYVDETNGNRQWVDEAAHAGPPQIFRSSGDLKSDTNLMFEEGYARIGYSGFNGELASEADLLQQAENVGAHAIVISQDYTNTVSSSIPITTNRAVTTYSSGSATVSGDGGTAFGTYSGSSTTYVPNTTYVPIQTDRYDQSAMFFAKVKSLCLGIKDMPISALERQEIGTNAGVKVAAVMKGSPMFLADVVPGDIILEVDGGRATTDSLKYLKSRTPIELTVYRSGRLKTIAAVSGDCE